MKLLFITNARIPTEKAHGLQIIKMCEAFKRQGMDVQLLVPMRGPSLETKNIADLWEYYNIDSCFTLKYLYTPDAIKLKKILPTLFISCLYQIQCLTFSLFALFSTMHKGDSIYYSRSLHTILVLVLTKWIHRRKVYFEAHELHGSPTRKGRGRRLWSRFMGWVLRRLDGMIVITSRLKALYMGMGVRERDILVAPDGVEEKRFSQAYDKIEARQRLKLPLDKTLIYYTGHLFRWKGVYTLAESSQYLPEEYLVCIIGGKQRDVESLQQFVTERRLDNVILTGHVPYVDIPYYQSAADALVLPNSAGANISREYTSPLKLFEYMAAQRPIVASDLPSLREVLRHRENAFLVRPDNPKALAEGVLAVVGDSHLATRLVETAYKDVQGYTWEKRAANIKAWIEITCGMTAC